ncbi:MAG: histidine phosphatase family protein [Propioniciclava sp.]
MARRPPALPVTAVGATTVTVYLARHGQTMLNSLGRIQGWCDSPLTVRGREQAAALGARLGSLGITLGAVRCGDMLRHHETASLALATGGFPVSPVRDARLREASFGPFEGATNLRLWEALAGHINYPDAETMFSEVGVARYLEIFDLLGEVAGETDLVIETTSQVSARALAALEDLVAAQHETGGGHVLAVTSGLTIVSLLRDLGHDLAAMAGEISNGSLSVLQHDGERWTIVAVNDPAPAPAAT